MRIWFLGGDARNRYAAEYFRDQGFNVYTFGVPETTNTPLPSELEAVVLPFPSFSGALLRGKSAIPIAELTEHLRIGTQVFGAQMNAYAESFRLRGACIHELYGTEPLTTQNAIPTAEGAICLAIEHSPITLNASRCLVCGFGRCGSILAQRLQALGASVCVAVRNSLLPAQTMGFQAQKIGQWESLDSFHFVFNTVPAPIFAAEHISQFSPDCLYIELAGGLGALEPDIRPGLHYLPAPGLPGRFAPKTAGILYAQSILKILESGELS